MAPIHLVPSLAFSPCSLLPNRTAADNHESSVPVIWDACVACVLLCRAGECAAAARVPVAYTHRLSLNRQPAHAAPWRDARDHRRHINTRCIALHQRVPLRGVSGGLCSGVMPLPSYCYRLPGGGGPCNAALPRRVTASLALSARAAWRSQCWWSVESQSTVAVHVLQR